MPVDATLVTVLRAYGMPGPPQSFTAKSEAIPVALTTMYDWRAYRRRRYVLSLLIYRVSCAGLHALDSPAQGNQRSSPNRNAVVDGALHTTQRAGWYGGKRLGLRS